jgi:hypothetical protein
VRGCMESSLGWLARLAGINTITQPTVRLKRVFTEATLIRARAAQACQNRRKSFFKDLNLAAFTAGFVAVLVGFTSSVAIVFQAALAAAVKYESHREAVLITFLVTLSGVVIAGVGSAFWGVVAGAVALFVQQYGNTRLAASSAAPDSSALPAPAEAPPTSKP